MEIKFWSKKKDTKVSNTICTQNIRVIKDVVENQHINFSGEENDSLFYQY
jgi:hypothetical protein